MMSSPNLVKVRSQSLANEALIQNSDTPDMDISQFSPDPQIKKIINDTSASKSTHDPDDTEFCCLPVEIFPGSLETVSGSKQPLKMPKIIENVSSLTLPLRLDILGNVSFQFLAAINPIRIGNSVV